LEDGSVVSRSNTVVILSECEGSLNSSSVSRE
jgi:hypothetical protein